MTNDLIAKREDQTHWYTGLGIAESIAMVAEGVESESWLESGIGAFATAAEAAAWATDPVGQLIQYGVSWLIEHLRPLRDAYDWLAGDPPQIEAYAQTWRNVSTFVGDAAIDLRNRAQSDTAGWRGSASDTYRADADALAQAINDTARTAELIGYVVSIAGMVVAFVRELVRDMIAELVAILLERAWLWAAETATIVGAPAAEAQVTSLIAKWVGKVARVIAKLVRSLTNLKGLTDKLDEIWDLLRKAWRRFRDGAKHDPGTPTTKDPITGPDQKTPDAPSTPGTDTSPSGADPASPTKPPDGSGDKPDFAKPPKDPDSDTTPSTSGGGTGNKPPTSRPPASSAQPDEPDPGVPLLDGDGGPSHLSDKSRPFNSAGIEYPEVIDPRTGQPIPYPGDNLHAVPSSRRVSWGRLERGTYIREWYDRGFETPVGGWDRYDIHHIVPREYGGTNAFENLVPVLRDVHQQQFNPWWAKY